MVETMAADRIRATSTTRAGGISFWTLEKGGLMYPRQVTTRWSGFPHFDETVRTHRRRPSTNPSSLCRTTHAARIERPRRPRRPTAPPLPAIDESKLINVADGVLEIQGGYNVSLIRQPDGIVVLEGTTSPSIRR